MKSSAKVKKRALSPGAFLVDELKRRWQLYLMLVLPLAYLIIFCYVPMGGVIIAFKDYSIRGGIWGSDWVGFKHFINFFNTPDFFKLLRNTLILSLYNLVITFPMPIILALAVNELKSKAYKKVVQMVTYHSHMKQMLSQQQLLVEQEWQVVKVQHLVHSSEH